MSYYVHTVQQYTENIQLHFRGHTKGQIHNVLVLKKKKLRKSYFIHHRSNKLDRCLFDAHVFLSNCVFFVCWQTQTNPLAHNLIISPHCCKQQQRLCVGHKGHRQTRLSPSICGCSLGSSHILSVENTKRSAACFCLKGNGVECLICSKTLKKPQTGRFLTCCGGESRV